jgi:hypothetical protein
MYIVLKWFKGLRFINNPKLFRVYKELWNQGDVLHVITLTNWVHNQGWDKTRKWAKKFPKAWKESKYNP